ncbi:unnamed protein product [Arctogadus glacialis]
MATSHFLDPFSPAVFGLFMLLAYLAAEPYEWYNPHPCLRDRRDLLENQYTAGQQPVSPSGASCSRAPRSCPAAPVHRCRQRRLVGFTLIIISSCTRQPGAFLTVLGCKRMEVPSSPRRPGGQNKHQYGTIHASTMDLLHG